LALIGCYWTAMDTTVRFWHKADIKELAHGNKVYSSTAIETLDKNRLN